MPSACPETDAWTDYHPSVAELLDDIDPIQIRTFRHSDQYTIIRVDYPPAKNMPEIVDDKSEHCVPFILDRIAKHRESYASKGEKPTPFFVGLNGVQGAGKTTLVCECPIDFVC